MPRPQLLRDATAWITEATLRWPAQLRPRVAERLGISPAAAGRLLQRLVDLQWLQRGGTPRRPVYSPGSMRQVVRRYPLAGLHEDTP